MDFSNTPWHEEDDTQNGEGQNSHKDVDVDYDAWLNPNALRDALGPSHLFDEDGNPVQHLESLVQQQEPDDLGLSALPSNIGSVAPAVGSGASTGDGRSVNSPPIFEAVPHPHINPYAALSPEQLQAFNEPGNREYLLRHGLPPPDQWQYAQSIQQQIQSSTWSSPTPQTFDRSGIGASQHASVSQSQTSMHYHPRPLAPYQEHASEKMPGSVLSSEDVHGFQHPFQPIAPTQDHRLWQASGNTLDVADPPNQVREPRVERARRQKTPRKSAPRLPRRKSEPCKWHEGCDKRFHPVDGREVQLCPRHFKKHVIDQKKRIPPSFERATTMSWEDFCLKKLYPRLPPLRIANDNYDVMKSSHPDYIAWMIGAINMPYTGQSSDLGDKVNEGRFAAQEELNLKELNQPERYNNEWVNIRARALFEAALAYHEGGASVYPVGGDNHNYGENKDLIFTDRLDTIIKYMKIDKCICMDVIEGRGVCGLVANPDKFNKRKEDNYRSNKKKQKRVKGLEQQLQAQGTTQQASRDGQGVALNIDRNADIQQRQAPTVPSMTPGQQYASGSTTSASHAADRENDISGLSTATSHKRKRAPSKPSASASATTRPSSESSSRADSVLDDSDADPGMCGDIVYDESDDDEYDDNDY